MFKNRFLLIIGVVSLLLVTVAVSRPFSNASVPNAAGANDYYQRHPELSVPGLIGWGASDYYQRHPELNRPAKTSVDLTDYYFRHSDE
jgi:hypothetical protein